MAFVIVQHLDPTHKGIMVELLQRAAIRPPTGATKRRLACCWIRPSRSERMRANS